MMITGVSGTDGYDSPILQVSDSTANSLTNAASSSTATTTGIDTVSLSTDTIVFAERGVTENQQASNVDSLFSTLNTNILDSPNLAAVGSAITKYTDSLASSNLYDSPYTAPSAKYLSDLSALKTAAASDNQQQSESLLATAKLDAPENISSAMATATSTGDTAGEAVLWQEVTHNMSDFLATQGYSSAGAAAEASAVTLNALSLRGANTATSSVQTRQQQVSELGAYAANNQGTSHSSTATATSDPFFNMIETLVEANGIGPNGTRTDPKLAGLTIDQDLTNFDTLYGVGNSTTTSNGF